MRRGPVLEVIEVDELTAATALAIPVALPAGGDRPGDAVEPPEEVAVVRA